MKIIAVLLAVMLINACVGTSELYPVWTGTSRVPESQPAPAGFKITPHQANQRVWDARRLSLKHIWHIYADGSDYYVFDSFLRSDSKMAQHGLIVDGQTGEIKN